MKTANGCMKKENRTEQNRADRLRRAVTKKKERDRMVTFECVFDEENNSI